MTATGTLARYISLRLLSAILVVFLLCLVLIFMIDFVELLRVSGKHQGASALDLIMITVLRLPSFAELIMPFAVLVGSIGTFLLLSRSSELVIIRAAGMSVWQFVFPGLIVALLVGATAVCVYNPLAAQSKALADELYAEVFGKSRSLLKTKAGSWLAQDGVDGKSIINAKHAAKQGMELTGVTVFQYDKNNKLAERIDAEKAVLRDGRWEMSNASLSIAGREPITYETYLLSTYLTPTEVKDALGSVESISFWELPKFINVAEKAGLSALRYKIQYQRLLAKPLVLICMVLLAATCALKPFRFGNIQIMVIGGIVAGFGFFIFAEVSRNLGLSGLVSPQVSTWIPVIVVCLLTLTVLLHQEDG